MPPTSTGSLQPKETTCKLTPHMPFGRQHPGSEMPITETVGQRELAMPGVVVRHPNGEIPPQAFAVSMGQHGCRTPIGPAVIGVQIDVPHLIVPGTSVPPEPPVPPFPAPPPVPPIEPPDPPIEPPDPPVEPPDPPIDPPAPPAPPPVPPVAPPEPPVEPPVPTAPPVDPLAPPLPEAPLAPPEPADPPVPSLPAGA
jgi:hypothetical protein